MEPTGDVLAPDLLLDDKSQYGFVQWFQALPQASLKSLYPALSFTLQRRGTAYVFQDCCAG